MSQQNQHYLTASQRLDDFARESGIQIARYQNPLDVNKTSLHVNPKLATASIHPTNDQDLDIDNKNNNISTHTPLNNNNTTKPTQFQSLLHSSTQHQSLEHQLPTSTHQSNTLLITNPNFPNSTNTNNNNHNKTPKSILKTKLPNNTNNNNHDNSTSDVVVNTNPQDNFTLDEHKAKAAGFYEIIETKLVPELGHFQQKRETTARTLHDLEQLIETISGLQIAQSMGQKTMECKVNVGCKVLAEAKFVNNGKIIIDIGLGIYTELTYSEATAVLQNRCEQLSTQLNEYEKQCCFFSSRIKGMHEAIGVLTEITEGPEERAPLRDVWV